MALLRLLALCMVCILSTAAAAAAAVRTPSRPAPAATAMDSSTNICGSNATVASWVLGAVNLTYPGLEGAAAAAAAGDANTACELIATYYRSNSSSGSWLRVKAPTPSTRRAGGRADQALADVFWLSGVDEEVTVPRGADGALDWHYKGPRDDPEAMNCINRFPFNDDLIGNGYLATGNPVYAAKAADLLVDWVLHLPCHPCATGTGESPWRTLEQGIRMAGPWPSMFYALQDSDALNTTARVLLLFGVSEHGVTLARDGTAGAPNWRMQQYTGLANLALAFPELANSSSWLATALAGITHEMDDEVYADGVETEETSGYDLMSAHNFFTVLATLRAADRAAPPTLYAGVERMFNYAAYAVDQHGNLPRNGDADFGAPWPGLGSVMAFFNRSDWAYVTTAGATGTPPPDGPPTRLFPWAGQFIMRSGWAKTDQWAFFDIGPYGSSGHAHRDKLHINVRANGSQLLVDSGRFAYNGANATWHAQYAPTTRAHNTLTLDGLNQQASPAVASAPVANSTWAIAADVDTARATMRDWDGLVGTASHTRAVLYRRGRYWVVVDVIDTDRPRHVQATWHIHPEGTVTLLGGGAANATAATAHVVGYPATMSLALLSAGDAPWQPNVSVVQGQQPPAFPHYQGWYSQNYTDCRPALVVLYDAAVPTGVSVVAWLLLPAAGPEPPAASLRLLGHNATHALVEVAVANGPAVQETVPIGEC